MPTNALRTETDGLGTITLPSDCLYGIHTARAVANFQASGVSLGNFPALLRSLAEVKIAAGQTNADLGLLPVDLCSAITQAATEVIDGQHKNAFPIDMIQGGAGTSTNMNMNEVIANLGLRHMGHAPGDYAYLHPNDHVNRSQSTNDVYPTALRIALWREAEALAAHLDQFAARLRGRSETLQHVIKLGRTQLQDAVPMLVSDELGAFASAASQDARALRRAATGLAEVNLGGTAIGTGINAPEGFAEKAIAHLSDLTGLDLVPAQDPICSTSDLGDFVTLSGALRRVAIRLSKTSNDLRLLSSGPRGGLNELNLPAMQAGSSIMPGKVNPVIPELVNQIAYRVIGFDMSVSLAAEAGQLQLNATTPLVAYSLLDALQLLERAVTTLWENCLADMTVNADICLAHVTNSTALATLLVPQIGYQKAAALTQRALVNKTTLAEEAIADGYLSPDTLGQSFALALNRPAEEGMFS